MSRIHFFSSFVSILFLSNHPGKFNTSKCVASENSSRKNANILYYILYICFIEFIYLSIHLFSYITYIYIYL